MSNVEFQSEVVCKFDVIAYPIPGVPHPGVVPHPWLEGYPIPGRGLLHPDLPGGTSSFAGNVPHHRVPLSGTVPPSSPGVPPSGLRYLLPGTGIPHRFREPSCYYPRLIARSSILKTIFGKKPLEDFALQQQGFSMLFQWQL